MSTPEGPPPAPWPKLMQAATELCVTLTELARVVTEGVEIILEDERCERQDRVR